MKIAIIGVGYVGLVTAACFSTMGNEVWCIDVDQDKISGLKNGIVPIYEPRLTELVSSSYAQGSLHFSIGSHEAFSQCDICFITVGTPMAEDGCADIRYVLEAARSIGKHMQHHMYVVEKSTVPIGTSFGIREVIQEELNRRGCDDLTFDLISNPEFLKEGNAVEDCMKPDRIIIGTDSEQAAERMRQLYKPFFMNKENFIQMDITSAEMTKYASNAMLACRISFMNEIANICERVGADVSAVRRGVGSDRRIGYAFIYPGCGYGGSCFPKDVRALIQTAREKGYAPELLTGIEKVNNRQKKVLVEKAFGHFGNDLNGRVFAVWGLSFKPDTDDTRESPSIEIIRLLLDAGARIRAYDPKAEVRARQELGGEGITYCKNKYEALDGVDALFLITEWKEFRSPDFCEMKKRLKTPIIFDGRNQYSKALLQECGFIYYQIGVPPITGGKNT